MMQDVDFVWMADPREVLHRGQRGRDVVGCDARRSDAHSPGNTGFVYFVSNYKTKMFINSIINLLPLKGRSVCLCFLPQWFALSWNGISRQSGHLEGGMRAVQCHHTSRGSAALQFAPV